MREMQSEEFEALLDDALAALDAQERPECASLAHQIRADREALTRPSTLAASRRLILEVRAELGLMLTGANDTVALADRCQRRIRTQLEVMEKEKANG
jgi:hypothetical protein